MCTHQAIPIKVSYTDTTGKLVETTFNSIYKASKTLKISASTLKELSFGRTPQLRPDIPQDIKVVRIQIQKPQDKQKDPTGVYHCEICNKDMKTKSKYEHVQTMGHIKRQEAMNK